MKIIIDARMILKHLHGIGRYLHEILCVIRKERSDFAITLLTNDPANLEPAGFVKDFQYVKVKSRPFDPQEMVEIPSVLRGLKADLYHASSISVPLYEIHPTVITILDLIPCHFGKFIHKAYCRTVLQRAVNYARSVITISEYSRSDVLNYFRCSPDKVHVTYLASNLIENNPLTAEEVLKKYNISSPFILSLGNPKPHKNMKSAIDIFEIIKQNIEEPLQLVFITDTSLEIRSALDKYPIKGDIVNLKFIDDNELDILYKNAKLFIFPSLFEGFGLPPLEAMSRGCPTISSDRASLPESVGNGGILVNPVDTEAFAKHAITLLKDPELWREWSEKGREWAKRFSWHKCAMETINIYEKSVLKY